MSTKFSWRDLVQKLLRWLIPLGVSAGAIWLVFRNVKWLLIVENLVKISPMTYVWITAVFFLSYFFRVYCWYILMQRKVTYKDVFFTMGAGYLLNNLFPFRLGELGRAVLLDEPGKISTLEALSSVMVERIFDVFLAAVFVLSMVPRLLSRNFDQRLIMIAFIITSSGMLFLYLTARYRLLIISWLNAWGEKQHFVKSWVTPKAHQVLEGLSVLSNPISFLISFGSLVVSWLFAFVENYIVFQDLYSNPPFWWMVFVLGVGTFGAALPSAPAGIGVFEGMMVAAFILLGVSSPIALTHAIVIHVLSFVITNIIGLIGLRMRGEAVISLYRRVVNRQPKIQAVE